MDNAKDILKKRKSNRERLEKEAPDLYHGFNELVKRYYKHGALDRKQKELMAVAASVATRCIPCLANHANNAILAGAKRDEVLEAAAIGIEFGGGPFISYSTLTFQDGSTIITHNKGISKEHSASGPPEIKITAEIIKGTGRFEGIKGTVSTWNKAMPLEKGELGEKILGETTLTYTLPKK